MPVGPGPATCSRSSAPHGRRCPPPAAAAHAGRAPGPPSAARSPSTRVSPSTARRSLRPDDQPIDTWSSCMALDGIESTLAGTASRLSSRDDRGRGVLRDHVAGVDARVVGEERRQALAAGDVEEPVGAPLRHAGDVGDGDRQVVQRVGDRRAVEVAVGLDPAVGQHDRVVDRPRPARARPPRRRTPRCRAPRRAPAARSAASRRPGPGCSRGRGGWPRSPSPASSARTLAALASLARVRAQRLQVGGEHPVGAEQGLDAHRGDDVGGTQQQPQVVQREHAACRACRRCR